MGAATSHQQNVPTSHYVHQNRTPETNVVVDQNSGNSQIYVSNTNNPNQMLQSQSRLGLGTGSRYREPKIRGNGNVQGQRTSYKASDDYVFLNRELIGLPEPKVESQYPKKIEGPTSDFSKVSGHYAIKEQTDYTLKNLNSIFAKDINNFVPGQGTIYSIKQYNATYQGEFDRGIPHGKGVAHFQDGGYYNGDFFQGDAHGNGFYIYPNGSVYEGNFRNSKFNGKGSLIYVDKRMRYDGEFVDGLPQGNGIETYNQGDRYQGHFNRGLKEGYGVYTWANGLRYEGNWKEGLMHGNGVILNGTNVVYQGAFQKGQKSGSGAFRTDKGTYEGTFSKDYLNGPGSFFWNDGRLYVGNFFNTMMQDKKGKIIYPNGQIAEGQWHNNHNKLLSTVTNDSNAQAIIKKYRNLHDEKLTYRPIRQSLVGSGNIRNSPNTNSQLRYGESNFRNQESYQSDIQGSDRGGINRTSNIRNSNSNLVFEQPKAHEYDLV